MKINHIYYSPNKWIILAIIKINHSNNSLTTHIICFLFTGNNYNKFKNLFEKITIIIYTHCVYKQAIIRKRR